MSPQHTLIQHATGRLHVRTGGWLVESSSGQLDGGWLVCRYDGGLVDKSSGWLDGGRRISLDNRGFVKRIGGQLAGGGGGGWLAGMMEGW